MDEKKIQFGKIMKTGTSAVTAAVLGLLMFSCQHARINIKDNPVFKECERPAGIFSESDLKRRCQAAQEDFYAKRKAAAEKVHEVSQNFIVWGMYPKYEYKTSAFCPLGVSEVYSYATWRDELFTELTLGFYAPRTLRFTCL